MKLDLWKKKGGGGRLGVQALWKLHSLHAFHSMGHSLGHFLSAAFSKGACAAAPAKGAVQWVNCHQSYNLSFVEVLDKLDLTTVYPVIQGQLHHSAPPKPVTDGRSFGEPSVRSKQRSNDCSTVLPPSLLGVII